MRSYQYWIIPILLLVLIASPSISTPNDFMNEISLNNADNSTRDEAEYKANKKNMTSEDIDDAVKLAKKTIEDLINIKEPMWFKMGLFLEDDHPATKVAQFGKPNRRAAQLSRFGLASLEASRRLAQSFQGNLKRQIDDFPSSRLLQMDCPLRGTPRCNSASRKYRTSDGTCNNFDKPWRGASMQPMQRFLAPSYEDEIQSVRRSVLGPELPSARKVSQVIHTEQSHEMKSITLMFMQWGQFIDHDITSSVKSRSFNGTVPRCCERGGREMLPPELTHPSCLPIEIPTEDKLFRNFGVRCMEFIRSAPSTRINCDFGWREQINQVTAYIDASTIYGSDIETQDSIRTFKNGKIVYGPLEPLDSREGELCTSGALTSSCFEPGDSRVSEQPGLTALHTIWIRFHNKVATILSRLNPHWSDEKLFQETRKILYSMIQHITYREFLPIALGPEVMDLFELNLNNGFYNSYDNRVDPAIANSFGAAAYRFGHSLVQNSYIRFDSKHRPMPDIVLLHEEAENTENIWSVGSLERFLLGLCNQASQRRDEFICRELSNHLFQKPGTPFGMDLPAINIQRGRDHGIPSYTAWRTPCGLSPIENWRDLENLFSFDTVQKFKQVYLHVDDIDLFSGGLAEKPVRGGVVGPTFACIIAQQFLNLRKGDRFWYENVGFKSSFTPAQLREIKKITLAKVFCQTMNEIRTIQPYVFLAPDEFKNSRLPCDSSLMDDFEFSPWAEPNFNVNNRLDFARRLSRFRRETARKNSNRVRASTVKPMKLIQKQYVNVTYSTPRPETIEINIKIQPAVIPTTKKPAANRRPTTSNKKKKKRPTSKPAYNDDVVFVTSRPPTRKTTTKPNRKTAKPTAASISNKRPATPAETYYTMVQTISPPKKPTRKPEVIYPVFVQYQPNIDIDFEPNNNYYSGFSERPDGGAIKPSNNYHRPSNTKPSNIYEDSVESFGVYQRPTITSFPNSKPIDFYDDDSVIVDSYYDKHKPSPSTTYYESSNFDNRPFASSGRPIYYDVTTNAYDSNRKKPYDKIDEVYGQLWTNQDKFDDIPKKPSFGQLPGTIYTNFNQHGNKYSIGVVEKIEHDQVRDKLDFKTTLLSKRRGNSIEKLNVVHIQSLQDEIKKTNKESDSNT